MTTLRTLIPTLLGSMLAASALASSGPHVTALVGGTVVNLDGGPPLRNAIILIEDERISAIGSADDIEVPAGATVIAGV